MTKGVILRGADSGLRLDGLGVVAGLDERWPRWWTGRQKGVLEEALARVELVLRMLEGG